MRRRLVPAFAVCALLLLGADDPEDPAAEGEVATPAGTDPSPWYAPWRALDLHTSAGVEEGWSMVRRFFGNMRQGHAHEVWLEDGSAMAPARPVADCLAALEEEGLDFPRVDRACRMSAQVEVSRPVEGVTFTEQERDGVADPLDLGCELALRLPRIAKVLYDHGVRKVFVGSPARFSLRSYHRFGLALDVYKLELEDGTVLVVHGDYVEQPDEGTCDGDPPAASGGAKLREVACALFDERVLSTVITPNYNEGHDDHFHWDVRPGDERFYLR
jgi:hypothetical protein